MKLAIQGCSHGELDAIYASVLRIERERSIHIDALLLCGDFQAVRNPADLHALSVPPKYRQLGEFHAYYAGRKLAPVLTLVIGGNHEASNYMHELYHGGWLAPNIYFLGAAGAVELNGLLVAVFRASTRARIITREGTRGCRTMPGRCAAATIRASSTCSGSAPWRPTR